MSGKSSNPVTDALNTVVPKQYRQYIPWLYRSILLVLVWAFIGLFLGDMK